MAKTKDVIVEIGEAASYTDNAKGKTAVYLKGVTEDAINRNSFQLDGSGNLTFTVGGKTVTVSNGQGISYIKTDIADSKKTSLLNLISENLIYATNPISTFSNKKKLTATGTKYNDTLDFENYVPESLATMNKSITLNGGAGHDTIIASKSADIITGGAGDNTVVYKSVAAIKSDIIKLTKNEDLTIDLTQLKSSDSDLYPGVTKENVSVVKDGKNIKVTVAKDLLEESFTISNLAAKDITTDGGSVVIHTSNGDIDLRNDIFLDAYEPTANFTGTWLSEEIDATNTAVQKNKRGKELGLVIKGGAGNDKIYASKNNATTIYGGAGDDKIYSGVKDDIITGGTGRNNIYYEQGDGHDTINLTKGEKLTINLSGYTSLANLDFKVKGKDLVIIDVADDNKTIMTLKNFGAKDVTNNATKKTDNDSEVLLKLGETTLDLRNDVYIEIEPTANYTGTWLAEDIDASEAPQITNKKGKPQNLVINAGGGNDVVTGSAYSDTIKAGDGADTVYGGDGDDLIYGGNGNDTLAGQEGDDTIYGDDGDDKIYGHKGNDKLYGGKGDDTFYFVAGDGNDVVFSETGADTICILDATDDGLIKFVQSNNDLVIKYGIDRDSDITVKNFYKTNRKGERTTSIKYLKLGGNERIELTDEQVMEYMSDSHTDSIKEIKAGGSYTVEGDDIDTIKYILASEKDDNINATDADNNLQINAGDGNNTVIVANTRNNTVYSGSGDDTITTGSGTDVINAGDGVNTITTGEGFKTITTGNSTDTDPTLEDYNTGSTITLNGTHTGAHQHSRISTGTGNDKITIGQASYDIEVTSAGGNNEIRYATDENVSGLHDEGITITTGDGDDTVIIGHSGENPEDGGATTDNIINVGDGKNTINFEHNTSDNVITTGSGNDTILFKKYADDNEITDGGGTNSITFAGGGCDNEITAGGSNTITLTGSCDDNVITTTGETGTNTITFGDGSSRNTLSLKGASNTVVIAPEEGEATAFSYGNSITVDGNGTANITIAKGYENTVTSTGSGKKTVTIGNGRENTVTTGSGDDEITLGDQTILGTNYASTINAGDGANVISVGAGYGYSIKTGNATNTTTNKGSEITLAGDNREAHIETGTGNDTIKLLGPDNSHGSVITSEGGNNIIEVMKTVENYSYSSNVQVTTGDGDDTITFGLMNGNTISAGNGDNTITVRGANNTITTGTGADTISAEWNANTHLGNTITIGEAVSGTVTVSGGTENRVTLKGGSNTLTINNSTQIAGKKNIINIEDGDSSYKNTVNVLGGHTEVNATGKADITTGAGNDEINIKGDDTAWSEINAGNGNNIIVNGEIDEETDAITNGQGSIEIITGSGADRIYSGGGGTIKTGAGNDTIVLDSGGTQYVYAGAGNDTITLNATKSGSVEIHLDELGTNGHITVESLKAEKYDSQYIDIVGDKTAEYVAIKNEKDMDITVYKNGQATGDVITIKDAYDNEGHLIEAFSSYGQVNNLYFKNLPTQLITTGVGTEGNEWLVGTSGNDTITTGRGDDWVKPGAGNDTVTLGDNADDKYIYFTKGSGTTTVKGITILTHLNILTDDAENLSFEKRGQDLHLTNSVGNKFIMEGYFYGAGEAYHGPGSRLTDSVYICDSETLNRVYYMSNPYQLGIDVYPDSDGNLINPTGNWSPTVCHVTNDVNNIYIIIGGADARFVDEGTSGNVTINLGFASTTIGDRISVTRGEGEHANDLIFTDTQNGNSEWIISDYYAAPNRIDYIKFSDSENPEKLSTAGFLPVNEIDEHEADEGDVITGSWVKDNITGTPYQDTISGGKGNDNIYIETGVVDTLSFTNGDGNDVVYAGKDGDKDVVGEVLGDVIHFDTTTAGANFANINMSLSGNDLVIKYNGIKDSITIKDYIVNGVINSSVKYIEAGDERVLISSLWNSKNGAITINQSDDETNGTPFVETITMADDVTGKTVNSLAGQTGADVINVNALANTYAFSDNGGADVLDALSSNTEYGSVIRFTDLTPAKLTRPYIKYEVSGNDLIIKYANSADTLDEINVGSYEYPNKITLKDYVTKTQNSLNNGGVAQFDQLAGSDGVIDPNVTISKIFGDTWDFHDASGATKDGGIFDDTFIGSSSGDTFSGGLGANTYVVDRNPAHIGGHDNITQVSGRDTIKFDYQDLNDLTITRVGDDKKLNVAYDMTSSVTVSQNAAPKLDVIKVVDKDGDSKTIFYTKQNGGLTGTSGDDLFIADTIESTVEGGKGNDEIHVVTTEGANTYKFSKGDGNDIIIDDTVGAASASTIFMNDMYIGDTDFERVDYDLVIHYNKVDDVYQDKITLNDFFNSNHNSVKNIKYGDSNAVSIISQNGNVHNVNAEANYTGNTILNDCITLGANNITVTGGTAGYNSYIVPTTRTATINIQSANDRIVLQGWNYSTNYSMTTSGDDVILTSTDAVNVNLTFKNALTDNAYRNINIFSGSGLNLGTLDSFMNEKNIFVYDNPTIQGTGNNDYIRGGASSNEITALAGADTIFGGGGGDVIYGGDGADTIYGDGVDIAASDGNDTIYGGAGDDEIYTGGGNDNVWGGEDDDTIYATHGTNTIHFAHAAGGDYGISNGHDTVQFANSADNILKFHDASISDMAFTVNEGYGRLTINYGDGDNVIVNNLIGRVGTMILEDENGDSYSVRDYNYLTGTEGKDIIFGTSNANTITGNTEDDILYGLGGNDTFVFNKGDGDDVVMNAATGASALKFSDTILSDTNFVRSNNDLVVNYNYANAAYQDSVTVKDYFTAGNTINQIKFGEASAVTHVVSSAETVSRDIVVGAGDSLCFSDDFTIGDIKAAVVGNDVKITGDGAGFTFVLKDGLITDFGPITNNAGGSTTLSALLASIGITQSNQEITGTSADEELVQVGSSGIIFGHGGNDHLVLAKGGTIYTNQNANSQYLNKDVNPGESTIDTYGNNWNTIYAQEDSNTIVSHGAGRDDYYVYINQNTSILDNGGDNDSLTFKNSWAESGGIWTETEDGHLDNGERNIKILFNISADFNKETDSFDVMLADKESANKWTNWATSHGEVSGITIKNNAIERINTSDYMYITSTDLATLAQEAAAWLKAGGRNYNSVAELMSSSSTDKTDFVTYIQTQATLDRGEGANFWHVPTP